jgi:starch-binding outer membrane protein, SusD/RagB family
MSNNSAARRAMGPVGVIAAAVGLASCTTDILSVGTPDVLSAPSLAGPLGATTLRHGAVRELGVAYSGVIDAFVISTGNMADEIQTSDTFADRIFTDGRKQTEVLGGATNTTYNNLQLARSSLASAITAWRAAKLNPIAAVNDSLAELYALRGFSETFFAEAYCSGVPFSSVSTDGSQVFGDPLTTAQILARATASFDTASGLTGTTTAGNLARIGKGRALLNLGQFAQAAAAVSGVPTTFRYSSFHSDATTAQNNGVYNATTVNASRYTVGTREGTNGIDFLTTPADPRVPWQTSVRTGFDGTSRNLPVQLKYGALNSAVPIAEGAEARLIEAEARLNATSGGTQADRDAMFAQLNALRATGLAAAIAPLAASPTTQAEAVDMLFKERALWMWLTGHRLGDLRRLIRQYGRTAATVFPSGPMTLRPGEVYGTDVNFIIPFPERNNKKYVGCIDRNP